MGTGTINSLLRHKNALVEKHKTLDNDIKTAYTNHINDIEPVSYTHLTLPTN